MSGTKALAEFDSYLNDLYNEYVAEDDYDFAEIVDGIRNELDKLYNEYLKNGD